MALPIGIEKLLDGTKPFIGLCSIGLATMILQKGRFVRKMLKPSWKEKRILLDSFRKSILKIGWLNTVIPSLLILI